MRSLLLLLLLLNGCASAYVSLPLSKATGAVGGSPAAAHSSAPGAHRPSVSAWAVLGIPIDIAILPFTLPVDLVLWLSGAAVVENALERARHLRQQRRTREAYDEVLGALMVEPDHAEALAAHRAYLRLAESDPALAEELVQVALVRFDELAGETSDRDWHFRRRTALMHEVLQKLAPEHERAEELGAAAQR